jgi:hypothetical protein
MIYCACIAWRNNGDFPCQARWASQCVIINHHRYSVEHLHTIHHRCTVDNAPSPMLGAHPSRTRQYELVSLGARPSRICCADSLHHIDWPLLDYSRTDAARQVSSRVWRPPNSPKSFHMDQSGDVSLNYNFWFSLSLKSGCSYLYINRMD